MLKKWQKAMACLMAMATLGMAFGCEGAPAYSTPEPPVEEVDPLRTQLYLYNTDFSGGSAWLQRIADKFELLHAGDTCWEDGKTGVQVIVRTSLDRDEDLTARLKTGAEEIYFSQTPSYRALASQDLLMDLTETVTAVLRGETRSIADKMSGEQKEYYGIPTSDGAGAQSDENGNSAYYGIPYRSGTFGFVYNVEFFEEYGYYFSAEPTSEIDPFVKTETERRSAGPDGKWNTYDDGLPATYVQFFALCDKISSNGQIPVTFGGATYGEYLTLLANALATDCDGYEQTMLRYTLDGEAKTLGDIKNGGFQQDGTPLQVTDDNGYELVCSAGVYRALEFVRKLILTPRYYDNEAFRVNSSQSEAQVDFTQEANGTPMRKTVAMLADGSWWQSGKVVIDEAEPANAETAEGRPPMRFGFLPLPKARKAQVGEESTLFNCLSSSVFVSARVKDWKKPLVEDFLRFIGSDEVLKDYMLTANASVALDVTLTEAEESMLSYFGKSSLNAQRNAKVVYPYATNPLILRNEEAFSIKSYWGATFALASPFEYFAEAFRKNNVSVVDYFKGMRKSREEVWSTLKKD